MRKLWLLFACCAVALMLSYSPPPARSRLPSLGINHAAAQVFQAQYRRTARRINGRRYQRAARYGAYAAGATAGYYGYPYGYGGYGGIGYGGYYGGYVVYGPPFALYTLWLSMQPSFNSAKCAFASGELLPGRDQEPLPRPAS